MPAARPLTRRVPWAGALPAVRTLGDPGLRTRAKEIDDFSGIPELAQVMVEVMHQHGGAGLAAPQIGVALRLIAVRVPGSDGGDGTSAIVIANPQASPSGEAAAGEEGCLSLPGVFLDVVRPASAEVSGLSPEGAASEFAAGGTLARVIQHEIDHLDGILITDRVPAPAAWQALWRAGLLGAGRR